MGDSIYRIGISGLQAAQAGLITAGHNIANATTPGYSRQQVIQTNAEPQFTGSGFLGSGTDVVTVRRIYSDLLGAQVLSSASQSSELDVYYAQMRQIDNVVADPAAGLSPALQDFFTAVQAVATYPNVTSSRQALLSAAAALDSRFEALNQRFTEMRNGINQDVTVTAESISTYARQIAELNQRIVLAGSGAGGQPPNDLLDQRDRLVADLNAQVRATVVVQDDGAYNVFIGNGQPLVAGVQAYTLEAIRDPLDAQRVTVGYRSAAGVVQLPESTLSGGRLGGLFAFRNEALDPAQNALGRVAVALAQTFNDQHRLGQDMTGQAGGDFFSIGMPQISASTRNTGNAVISAVFAADAASTLTASDYRLGFDGSNYTLTRLSNNSTQTFAGLPLTVDGFTLTLGSGTPAAGDTFMVRPTAGAATNLAASISDPVRVAAAAPIRTAQGEANSGSGRVDAGVVDMLDANLQQPVTITFTSATTFDVIGTGTGDPTGLGYTPGQDVSFNGWTIRIEGTPAAGDSFSVGPNTGGTGDNRNMLLLAGLQTAKLMAGGTASYQSAYASLVSQVGNKTRELEITSAAQATMLEQAKISMDAFSGVNLDEEAANLMRYQQAYQASGKMLQIAATLFDTLLALGR